MEWNWGIFIGILSLIVGIVIPIILHMVSRKKKELSYQILSTTSLSVSSDISTHLKFTFNGQEINEDISLILLKIVNTGNVSILEEDFKQPIRIDVESNGILLAALKESNPSNLVIEVDNTAGGVLNNVLIDPLLLNKEDAFILKLLVKDYKNKISLQSRIIDVKDIKVLKEKYPISKLLASVGITSFIALLIFKFIDSDTGIALFGGIIAAFLTESVSIFMKIRKAKTN